jgi:tetratricopeptide (TPR) repeat protein
MSRSRVLTGQLNQRDRAQLRGRLDGRKQESAQSPVDELRAWLTAELSVDDVSEAETLDLTEFLRNTGQIDLPPDERLRQLAVFLEPDLCSPQPRGWLALDRIYQQAIRIAPKSVWAHHSRALSAKYCAEGLSPNDDGATFRRILDSAWDAANTAYDLDSTDADVSYLMGSLYYIDPVRSVDEALEFFEESIEKDADHQWALLYRAHCLQDLERWTDATSAYDNVNPAYFVGPWAWRYELLLEQRAYCLFRSGDKTGATAQFQRVVDRWIANPSLAFGVMGIYTSEVARGELCDQLWAKFDELTQHEDWCWLRSAEQNLTHAEPTDEREPE